MEHHKLGLEKRVAVDAKREAGGRGLQAAEARRRVLKRVAVDGGKRDDGPGHQGLVVADERREVGQRRAARVRVPAGQGAVGGAVHGRVVRRRDGVGHEEQRRARVRDGHVRRRHGRAVVHAEARRFELPEPLGGVDGHKADVSGV